MVSILNSTSVAWYFIQVSPNIIRTELWLVQSPSCQHASSVYKLLIHFESWQSVCLYAWYFSNKTFNTVLITLQRSIRGIQFHDRTVHHRKSDVNIYSVACHLLVALLIVYSQFQHLKRRYWRFRIIVDMVKEEPADRCVYSAELSFL